MPARLAPPAASGDPCREFPDQKAHGQRGEHRGIERGLDEEGTDTCTVWGDEAMLVLWAPDYDGGHKAWVRWANGRDDIVPGSQVERRS